MKKKLIIATFTLLFVLPFSSELSYSQGVNKQLVNKSIESVNIHNPPDISLKPDKENNDYIPMKATAYDLSIQSCGKSYSSPSRGITRSGYNLNNKSRKEAMTVSSNRFTMGIKLYLKFPESHKKYNGIYVVKDTGNFKENVLDVYLGDFGEKVGRETIKFGRVDVNVKMIE